MHLPGRKCHHNIHYITLWHFLGWFTGDKIATVCVCLWAHSWEIYLPCCSRASRLRTVSRWMPWCPPTTGCTFHTGSLPWFLHFSVMSYISAAGAFTTSTSWLSYFGNCHSPSRWANRPPRSSNRGWQTCVLAVHPRNFQNYSMFEQTCGVPEDLEA